MNASFYDEYSGCLSGWAAARSSTADFITRQSMLNCSAKSDRFEQGLWTTIFYQGMLCFRSHSSGGFCFLQGTELVGLGHDHPEWSAVTPAWTGLCSLETRPNVILAAARVTDYFEKVQTPVLLHLPSC